MSDQVFEYPQGADVVAVLFHTHYNNANVIWEVGFRFSNRELIQMKFLDDPSKPKAIFDAYEKAGWTKSVYPDGTQQLTRPGHSV